MGLTHTRGVTVTLAATALALAGCTDDSDPGSSNRGSGNSVAETSVDNAYIVPSYALSCALQIDAPAYLSFTATNTSSTETEVLQDISTPSAASVSIAAPPTALQMGPMTSLAAGQPLNNLDQPAAPDTPIKVSLETLDPSVEPGKSFPVTFDFERAGTLTLNVPVEACPTQQ